MKFWTKLGRWLAEGNEAKAVEEVDHGGGVVRLYVVREGCLIDWVLGKLGKAAITLGECVIFRKGRKVAARVRHELVHVDQWREHGGWFFLKYAFAVDRYEDEAGGAEGAE